MSAAAPSFTDRFSLLAPDYDAVLCDVWGVVHNGLVATPEACDALIRFRRQGGSVVLITNAPRPGDVVQRFLDQMKIPRTVYDAIVSSGDVTRALIAARAGKRVFHLGPERDLPMYEGLDAPTTAIEAADYVVCSGLFDDTVETPQDYAPLIDAMRSRSLPMICANPDIVVERGEHLVYCAGAIADLYAAADGEVIYAGKPYRPIYQQAMAAVAAIRGGEVKPERVLAIGDSVRTDLKGADAFGIACLFVTGGIHAEEIGGKATPDARVLAGLFAQAGLLPRAVTRILAW
jgi:HAD superfamily hydrolase (TIGR01459 family)